MGMLMKNVRCTGNLNKKVRYNGNPHRTTPAGKSKHTIRGAIVRPENLEKRAIFGAPHRTTPAGQSKHAIKGAIVRPENPETSFAQESQKMYLECRVASNPSVLVFGRLNQARSAYI